jgi:hypothetical protein
MTARKISRRRMVPFAGAGAFCRRSDGGGSEASASPSEFLPIRPRVRRSGRCGSSRQTALRIPTSARLDLLRVERGTGIRCGSTRTAASSISEYWAVTPFDPPILLRLHDTQSIVPAASSITTHGPRRLGSCLDPSGSPVSSSSGHWSPGSLTALNAVLGDAVVDVAHSERIPVSRRSIRSNREVTDTARVEE